MATTPEFHLPQIAAARAKAWHQAPSAAEGTADPLLTLEAARTFVNEHGLVLFSPRALGAPAPSLVEATLGVAKPVTTPADAETARGLVARLVAEGSALPLNLTGGPGDLPDFVVSTAAFPFVFTLRGDKGWKRPPETSGPVKVTPLALHIYELLGQRGALTVGEIVPEIGREVTESAVVRALGELWTLLRVIPALQQGEGETLWELTTTRFLKAVKAGANAGQPTALSALVSLYLSQVFVATEEEIASFLSPLTARSRVREVLHGLTAGRQVNEAVIEGKTVVYIPDALPDFAQFSAPQEAGAEAATGTEEGAGDAEDATGTEEKAPGRIRQFEAKGDEGRVRPMRGKPAGAPRTGDRRAAGPRGPRAPRAGDEARHPRRFADREDGPGRRGAEDRRPPRSGDRPSFARPWDEERGSRPPRREAGEGGERSAETGRPPRRESFGGSRPPFRREGGAARPGFDRGGARGGADRPPFRRRDDGATGSDGARRRPFSPRRDESGAEQGERRPFKSGGYSRPDRGPRPEGDRPARFDRGSRPERPAGDRPFRPTGDRPFRPTGDRPFRPAGDRPFRPAGDRPFRPAGKRAFGGPREEGARPPRRAPGAGFDRPRRDREEGGTSRGGGARSFGAGEGRPKRPFTPGGGSRSFGDRPPREGGPQWGRPAGGGGRAGFGDRPRRNFGGAPAKGAGRGRPGGSGSSDRGPRPPARRPEDEA